MMNMNGNNNFKLIMGFVIESRRRRRRLPTPVYYTLTTNIYIHIITYLFNFCKHFRKFRFYDRYWGEFNSPRPAKIFD